MKLYAVQFRYITGDSWRWLADVHGHVEAWTHRNRAQHIADQKARYLGRGTTRVVRLDDLPAGHPGDHQKVRGDNGNK